MDVNRGVKAGRAGFRGADISLPLILCKRACRFVRIAVLLHLVSMLGLALFSGCAHLAISSLHSGDLDRVMSYGGAAMLCGVLALFAQMDACSRYQNYKKAKDLLFENGFQARIVNLFVRSRCQRDAVKIAAADLGLCKALDTYYKRLGYRWFHLIPDVAFHSPLFFLTWKFWKSTFFLSVYRSKYFLW